MDFIKKTKQDSLSYNYGESYNKTDLGDLELYELTTTEIHQWILKVLYAKDEITQDEFEEMKKALMTHG